MAANAEPGDEKQAPLIDHLIDLRFALGIGLRMEAGDHDHRFQQ